MSAGPMDRPGRTTGSWTRSSTCRPSIRRRDSERMPDNGRARSGVRPLSCLPSLEAKPRPYANLEAADGELLGRAGQRHGPDGVPRDGADAVLLPQHVLCVGADVETDPRLARLRQRGGDRWTGFGDAERGNRVLLDRENRRPGENADVNLV